MIAAPKTIPCSRHNDGKSFELERDNSWTESFNLVDTDLERILTKRVMRLAKKESPATMLSQTTRKGGFEQQKQQIQRQIFFCSRRDVVFLKCCDMAPDYNIRTILGVSEDNQCPRIEIVCYRAKACKQHRHRIRPGPHSDWKRRSLVAEVNLHVENDSTKIAWIDLREFQRERFTVGDGSLLSTEGGVVQFLRSVLTPSHDASPWNAAAEPISTREGKCTQGLDETYMSSMDIVVLVLNFSSNCTYENDFSLLKKFRVSDVAPSWFLHGFTHFEALEESSYDLFHRSLKRDFVDKQMKVSSSASTILIYKKLSPRRILHTAIPFLPSSNHDNIDIRSTNINIEIEDHEKNKYEKSIHPILEKGCLWEEYKPKESSDNCNHQKEENSFNNEVDSSEDTHRYRLVSPPYLNLDEEYPGANLFKKLFSKEALRIFTEDAFSVPRWTPWPETAHYKISSFGNEKPWTVFPLCHCFPANEPENFTWVPATKAFVPRTCRVLEEALRFGDRKSYLRTALFSQLAPRSVLEEHTGWADLANHVLRLHIPLVVPSNIEITDMNDDLCGTWVDGCVETHAVGRPILFDDSKTHRAFNYSDGDRIVLIVDLARPETLPLGTAESGHTEELDAFIRQMSVPK